MMYCDYPGIKPSDRLARAQVLDPMGIRLSPEQAWAQFKIPGEPDEVSLSMFDGRPAYWFRVGGTEKAVYADNGQAQETFSSALNLRTAAAWVGQPPAAASVSAVRSVDQWTVGGIYSRSAPLTKYTWPDGAQVYVSNRTGKVVQYTTKATRLGAWLGPIPHWLYFTPLRNNGKLWSRIVIWLSGAATVVAILGLAAGLSMYSAGKRYRFRGVPTGIPYSGTKRLHMILGLFFGLLACTWAFSGMLSMDPFPASDQSGGRTELQIADALSGEPFSFGAFQAKGPAEALRQAGAGLRIKQMEFVMIADQPFYLAMQDDRHSRLIPVSGSPASELSREQLLAFIMNAKQSPGVARAEMIADYDSYYLDRHRELPLPVLRARMKDPEHTTLYINPRTARIVGSYSTPEWSERWLYHGLHSMNLAWLYDHRPAWDGVVLTLMLGGVSLSVSGVILGWRLLRRHAIIRV